MKKIAALFIVAAMAAALLCSCASGVNVAGLKASEYIKLGDYENFTLDDLKDAYKREQERVATSYTQFNVDWGYTVVFNLVCEIANEQGYYEKYEELCSEDEPLTIEIYENTDDAYRASFDSALVYNVTNATDSSTARSVRTITVGKAFDFLFTMPYNAEKPEISAKTVRFTVTPTAVYPPLYDFSEIEESVADFFDKYTYNRTEVGLGDIVVADIRGYENEELVEGCIYDDRAFTVGYSEYTKEFDEKLIGAKVGRRATFDVTFPDDWSDENLAGKTINFTVKVESATNYNRAVEENTEFKSLCELQQAFRLELFAYENISSIVYDRTTLEKVPQDLYDEYRAFFKNTYEARISSLMEEGNTREEAIEIGWGSDYEYNHYLDNMARNAVKETLACYCLADELEIKFTNKMYKDTLSDYTAWYNTLNKTNYSSGELERISNVNLLKVRFIEGLVSDKICANIDWLPLVDLG